RGRIGRVVHDEATTAEHAFEETSEGVRHPDARRVGGAQVSQKRVAEFGGRKNLLQFDQNAVNLLVDRNGGNWDRIARSTGKGDRSWRHLGVEHRTRSNFVPVVIFGLNPEDRDRGDAVLARDLLSELD